MTKYECNFESVCKKNGLYACIYRNIFIRIISLFYFKIDWIIKANFSLVVYTSAVRHFYTQCKTFDFA